MAYYDPNLPFSIDDWNKLIRDVNEILENPPEDTDCEPIDAIVEVTDPHLWSVEDVTVMRDKLIETCPDISFEEELVLWKQEIIDEIEEKMDEAWCDCEEDEDIPAVDEDLSLCEISDGTTKAGTTQEKSNSILEDSPCAICIGSLCHQTEYSGTWYPSPGPANIPLYNTICDSYDEVYDATFNFLTWMNKLPAIAAKIERYQGYVDTFTDAVDDGIALYNSTCLGQSPMPQECASIKADICSNGELAARYQGYVDTQVIEFKKWYDLAILKMDEANAAAVQNSAAALGLTGRFPTDHNVLAECMADAIPSDYSWWDWWDPSLGELGNTFDFYLNRASTTAESGVLPSVSGYRTNTKTGDAKLDRQDLRLSPDGTWYVKGWAAKLFNRNYTYTYVQLRHRWRCEPAYCDPDPGICVYPAWDDFEDWWWSQGWPNEGSCVGSCVSFACWIWQPLPPPDVDARGTDTWHITYQRRSGIKDRSEERDEWLDLYNNWYDEHEQYDDRHEEYC